MQYILTEEEYRELKEAPEKVKAEAKEIINGLCQQVADHMPIEVSWREGEAKPWGCIRSKDKECYDCDECPVGHLCMYERRRVSK